jgi:hypothetical protein
MNAHPRKVLFAGIAISVTAVVLFLFIWPVHHVTAGGVQSSATKETEATLTLPGNTQVAVQWHTSDGANVVFELDWQSNTVWHGAPANASSFSFISDSGTYYVIAYPVPGDLSPHFVSYSFVYDSPLL